VIVRYRAEYSGRGFYQSKLQAIPRFARACEQTRTPEAAVYPVEIHIEHEHDLTAKMAGMREWLDHRRFEPTVFRHTFTPPGIALHIEFAIEAEAAAFAAEFDGQIVTEIADTASENAGVTGDGVAAALASR
jgi:hypothetical protein